MPLYSTACPLPINRKIFRHKGGAPVIWKVAIFGAGNISSDSEYVWDGITTTNGKPEYIGQQFKIFFDDSDNYWKIYDSGNDNILYISLDLITWSTENADNPPPSSALSFSQSSYIQEIVLGGADSDQAGTYTWDGTTFIDGKPKYMGPLKTGAPENNYIFYSSGDLSYILHGYKTVNEEMINMSSSADLVSFWNLSSGSSEPLVSSIVYTA
jgi:hypothetical protein